MSCNCGAESDEERLRRLMLKAFDLGFDAGRHLGRRDGNPFRPGFPLYRAWEEGWLMGEWCTRVPSGDLLTL